MVRHPPTSYPPPQKKERMQAEEKEGREGNQKKDRWIDECLGWSACLRI